MGRRKHPLQEIVMTGSGVIRFTENAIIKDMLEQYPGGLNEIYRKFNDEKYRDDYEQLTMLIGYSVSGFGDLSSSRKKTVQAADRIAAKIIAQIKKESER